MAREMGFFEYIGMKAFKPTVDNLYLKNTMIYGATGTGKTTIIHDILFTLKDVIPSIVIFSSTAKLNGAYDGIVPNFLIHDVIDIAKLEEIISEQEKKVKIYKNSKDLDQLYNLFTKVASSNDRMIDKQIKDMSASAYVQINESSLPISTKKQERNRLKSLVAERLETLYKKCIRQHRKLLLKMKVSQDDKLVIKYLDMNPNLFIGFDDVTADFTKSFQHEKVIEKIYTQGRWIMTTTAVGIHDDTKIDTSVRKGVHNSIFTTPNCATSFFNNKANSFTKEDKLKCLERVNFVFNNSDNDMPKHTKLIYLRNPTDGSDDYVQSYLATEHDDFRFGAEEYWMIDEKATKKSLKFLH